MTTADNSIQRDESRRLWSRLRTTVADAFDDAKDMVPSREQVRGTVSDQTTRVSDAYGQAKSTVGLRDYAAMAQMLRDWLPELAKDSGLAKRLPGENRAAVSWLSELPEDELVSFTRDLYAFCSSIDFDLAWLSKPETRNIIDEQLMQTVGEIVRLYGLARWKAAEMQKGIKVFVNLQQWLERPFASKYAEFNQQLFTKLVAEKLVAAPPIELFMAPEDERKAYTVQEIKELIARDNQRFYEILKAQVELAATELENEAAEEGEEPVAEGE